MKNTVVNLSLFTMLLVMFIGFHSCNPIEYPTFRTIENLDIVQGNSGKMLVTGDVLFYNPNIIGGTFDNADINVFANDMEIGKFVQTEQVKIDAKSEFSVPSKVEVKTKDLMKDLLGTLGNILNSLSEKKVDLRFDGTANVVIQGQKISIPIKFNQTVKI